MTRLGYLSTELQESSTDGKSIISIVYATDSLTLSSTALTLGGFPLSLYDDGAGGYVIAVIVETETSANSTSCIYNGANLKIVSKNDKNLLAVFNNDDADTRVSDHTIWRGVPISLNNDNQIILKKVEFSSHDNEDEILLGGTPLTIRQINGKWYLVVAETT